MPTAVENYIFNELPRRVVIDSGIPTGSNFTAAWLLVATGVGSQVIPVDPATLGFEPEVTPPGVNPEIKFWNGNKDWIEISAAAIGAIPASEKGQALGVATLDADGYVQLSQMNPAVIERVVAVADEAARYALTIADVQNGDVVNQQSPLPATMWYVVDDTNLNNSSGYLPFSAGVAASVAWSGITGKPAIIGDLENISLADEGDVIQYVAGQWINVAVADLKSSLAITISDVDLLQNELDLKQSQSTILDNLSAISTKGVVVRTSDGAFIGREVVGVNGIAVTEGKGDADNISLSLTEVGTAGTYGDDDNYPTYDVDAYGRVTSTTVKSLVKDTLTLLDQVADQTLAPNTTYQIGAYVETLNLLVPDPVVGGTKITLEVPLILGTPVGDINVSFPSGKELFGFVPSISLKSMMNPLPGDRITFTYIDNLSQWVVYKAPGHYLRELYLVGDSTANPTLEPSFFHSVASKATDSRVLSIPDRDVDLSSVGQTEFTSSEFSVVDPTDPSKKVAFSVGSVGAGNTSIITVPDSPVDLGKVAQAASTLSNGYLTSADFSTFSSSRYFYELLNPTGSTRAAPLEVGKSYRLSGSATAVAESTPIFLPSATEDAFGNDKSAPISFVVGDNSVSGRGFLLSAQPGQGILYTGSTGIVTGPLIGAADPTAPTEATAVWVPNFSSVTCYMIANGYWFVSILHVSNRMPSDKLFLVDPLDATKRAKFITSGIGTSQTRSITVPDANVDLGKVAQAASTSVDGYLTAADWNIFNDGSLKSILHNTNGGTITLTPGKKLTQIISTVATMTLTGGVATDQSEIVRIIARVDTTISLSSPLVTFENGHSGAGSISTMTLYRGQTVDLVQPAASGLFVHGSHIQISGDTVGSFALYKPATNTKVTFDMSTVAGNKVITIPNNSVNLGDPYVGYFSDWPYGYNLSSVSFATSARVTGARANGTTGVIIDLKGVALAQGILGNIARTHPTTMPSARYSLIGATAADLNITGLVAPEFIEVVNTSAASTVKLTRTGATSYFTDWSTTWVAADTYTFSLGIGEKLFVHPAQSSTSCRVSRSGDIVIYPNDRTVNFRSRFIAPTPFTDNWTITVPNANVNLGDLPSIATTNNNALSGTRTFCLMGGGGSLSLGNSIQGTDTGAIGSTGCDMRGTRNVAYSSTRVGTDATATDNSFYNCSSTQPVELVTTIGVRYENCTYFQLRSTVTWPNYSRVVGSGDFNASSTVVYTRLRAINVDSTPQYMTTGGTGSNTEVVASGGIYITALHDIVVIFTDYNTSGAPKSIFQRRVAVDAVGGIISDTSPVPDIVVGTTVYTLSISVVSNKLRLTVQSNIGSSSTCNAEVISRYF